MCSFHGGALGVFVFVCYQNGSFGREIASSFPSFAEIIRVGVLERRRTFSTEQKVIILPKVGTAFSRQHQLSLSCQLLLCMDNKSQTSGISSQLRRVDFSSGMPSLVVPDGLVWTGSVSSLANPHSASKRSDYNPLRECEFHRSRFSSPGRAPD